MTHVPSSLGVQDSLPTCTAKMEIFTWAFRPAAWAQTSPILMFFLGSTGPHKRQPDEYWSDQLWPREVLLYVPVKWGKRGPDRKGRRKGRGDHALQILVGS